MVCLVLVSESIGLLIAGENVTLASSSCDFNALIAACAARDKSSHSFYLS